MSEPRLSRRALLGAAATGAAAAQQAPPAAQRPEPAAARTAIGSAQARQQADYEQMRKVALSFSVEPATVFRP